MRISALICSFHPRSRGEHAVNTELNGEVILPPPLTRGAPMSPALTSWHYPSTPAHAGSTVGHLDDSRAFSFHPRSRGEHGEMDFVDRGVDLPPPLTRGAQMEYSGRMRDFPSTPAHAGSTPGSICLIYMTFLRTGGHRCRL